MVIAMQECCRPTGLLQRKRVLNGCTGIWEMDFASACTCFVNGEQETIEFGEGECQPARRGYDVINIARIESGRFSSSPRNL